MRAIIFILFIAYANNSFASGNYCIPVPPNDVDGHSITHIRLESLDTSFAGPSYLFVRDSVHHETCYLTPGSAYKIHLTSGSHSVSTLAAWIDWNNDSTLSSSEKLGEFVTSSPNETDSISFVVPLSTDGGKLRLRIRSSNAASINACSNYLSGQTLDFTITVLNPFYQYDFYTNWQNSSTGGYYLDGIRLENLDNQNSGNVEGPVYHDYSYLTADITACTNYYLHISGNFSPNNDVVYAFIDFNNNGWFEVIEAIGSETFSSGSKSDSILFATPAVSGNFRMRIMLLSTTGIIEVEDYSIHISSSTSQSYPQAIIGSDLYFSCDSGCYYYGCTGPVKFYDWSCGVPSSRVWTAQGASPSTSTSANPTFNFPNPGIYTITLKDSNSIGSDIISAQVYISPPVINFSLGQNITLCNGDSLLLSAPNGNPSDCYSYLWSTGSTSRQIYAKTPGTYFVKVSSCNLTDCPAYDTIVVNFSPLSYAVNGGGNYCAGGNGSEVRLSDSETGVNYQLYNNGNPVGTPVAGTGSAITFGLQTLPGTYTVRATNTTLSCTKLMGGFVNINIIQYPVVYDVTGGGSYCAGSGGVAVGLSNSDVNVSYQLFRDSVTSGSPEMGTGTGFFFPNHSTPGVYTVIATVVNSNCSISMNGSTNINSIPVPDVHDVTGGGTFCGGTPQSSVTLEFSDLGVSYELIRDGTPTGIILPGTDTTLTFTHIFFDGNYTIRAFDSSSCSSTMSGSATVDIIPTPFPYVLSGPEMVCTGTPIDSIILSSSDPWVRYQLYLDSMPVGHSLNGFGGPLNFGMQTTPGTYFVIGSNTITGCYLPMNGFPSLSFHPVPQTYNVIGGGRFCLGNFGVPVGLNGSDTNSFYQLYLNNSTLGLPVFGTDSALDFGIRNTPGVYTIVATTLDSLCSIQMIDSAEIIVDPLPTPAIAGNLPGVVCSFDPPITLTGTPAGGVFSGDGVFNGVFNPSLAGVQIAVIYYDYTDSNTGCSAYTSDSIFIDICNEVDEFNHINQLMIYPNPADDHLIFNLKNGYQSNVLIKIFTAEGKTVWSYSQQSVPGDFSKTVDLSGLASGLYFINLKLDEKYVVRKLVIQH